MKEYEVSHLMIAYKNLSFNSLISKYYTLNRNTHDSSFYRGSTGHFANVTTFLANDTTANCVVVHNTAFAIAGFVIATTTGLDPIALAENPQPLVTYLGLWTDRFALVMENANVEFVSARSPKKADTQANSARNVR